MLMLVQLARALAKLPLVPADEICVWDIEPAMLTMRKTGIYQSYANNVIDVSRDPADPLLTKVLYLAARAASRALHPPCLPLPNAPPTTCTLAVAEAFADGIFQASTDTANQTLPAVLKAA
ncbi:hypothetical protein BDK51DRAFT_30390 [Blyttiomyces helicus]|uniref:Uncharacterized protein n=1 Tax=Blyttiomyces helicus TaxID=388810 RepID=A0A4P9WHE2_9FUNG|nr:hypothetical protein BDK51DRAFT_30390 [Blyttiomyces helicus]|eukprot:RKO90500.1 hypothetical protein BDK51DRAFT_30390 [Blyttiomyces helicus]